MRNHLDGGEAVGWINGMLDASDGCGVRDELYEAVGLRSPVADDDGLWIDHPAYRDWFCVDASGSVLEWVTVDP